MLLAVEETKKQLGSGTKQIDVIAQLVEQEFNKPQIDQIIADAKGLLRKLSQQQGRKIAGSGLVLALISIVIFSLTLGTIIATGCLFLGMVMIAGGLLKAWTGWNLSGNDFHGESL